MGRHKDAVARIRLWIRSAVGRHKDAVARIRLWIRSAVGRHKDAVARIRLWIRSAGGRREDSVRRDPLRTAAAVGHGCGGGRGMGAYRVPKWGVGRTCGLGCHAAMSRPFTRP
ncbi:hypothetical protein GCM10023107_24920 [Actinoplanes octamycinicus]